MTSGTQTAYERAEQRIDETPALHPYREFCLADWAEGEEHYEWIATAPVAEIVGWAEAGQAER